MTDDDIADLIASLEWHADYPFPRPPRKLLEEAIAAIQELQERISAERRDHEATIALADADVRRWP